MSPDPNSADNLLPSEDAIFDLLAHLITSAEISVHEPEPYGTLRLLEAARLVAAAALDQEPAGNGKFLADFLAEVDRKRHWRSSDPEGYVQFLREAARMIGRAMRRRAGTLEAILEQRQFAETGTDQAAAAARERSMLESIRHRRVCRIFTAQSLPEESLWRILEAARWAPCGGNRRIHKFVVVQDREAIGLVRALAPGIYGRPAALILICTDCELARQEGVKLDLDRVRWIDVGTALENMLLVAGEQGLGACPATSFSQAAIQEILDLPDTLIPELIVQVGYPAPAPKRLTRPRATTWKPVENLVLWHRPRSGERERTKRESDGQQGK